MLQAMELRATQCDMDVLISRGGVEDGFRKTRSNAFVITGATIGMGNRFSDEPQFSINKRDKLLNPFRILRIFRVALF